MSANDEPKNNKTNKTSERRRRPIGGLILFIFAALIVVFVVAAHFIIADECASPCRGETGDVACPAVCVKLTLWDKISESVNKALASESDAKKIPEPTTTSNSYRKEITGYNRDSVSIIYGDDGVTIKYTEQIECIQAPCPSPVVTRKVNFSEENMDKVYAFVSSLDYYEDYEMLNYKDKRLLASMIMNEEEKIDLFEVDFYEDSVWYYITEQNGELKITTNNYAKQKNITLPTLTDEQKKSAVSLINRICSHEKEFRVHYIDGLGDYLTEKEVKLFYEIIGKDVPAVNTNDGTKKYETQNQ